MTNEELVTWVKSRLGYPVVQVEVPDDTIRDCIEDALDEVLPWYNIRKLVTVPRTGSVIDLTEYQVLDVTHVYNANSTIENGDPDNLGFFGEYVLNDTSTVLYSQLERLLYQQSLGYVKDNLSHTFYDNKLYLDTGIYYGDVTIEYIPKISDVSEVTDRKYLKYIKDFTLAFTRDILGDIRGKHRIDGSSIDLDYDRQYDKSSSELERLRESIKSEFLDIGITD